MKSTCIIHTYTIIRREFTNYSIPSFPYFRSSESRNVTSWTRWASTSWTLSASTGTIGCCRCWAGTCVTSWMGWIICTNIWSFPTRWCVHRASSARTKPATAWRCTTVPSARVSSSTQWDKLERWDRMANLLIYMLQDGRQSRRVKSCWAITFTTAAHGFARPRLASSTPESFLVGVVITVYSDWQKQGSLLIVTLPYLTSFNVYFFMFKCFDVHLHINLSYLLT